MEQINKSSWGILNSSTKQITLLTKKKNVLFRIENITESVVSTKTILANGEAAQKDDTGDNVQYHVHIP